MLYCWLVAKSCLTLLQFHGIALSTLLSMGFPRQESWSGLPFSPPGDLPDPGIEPESLAFPALAGGFFTISATWDALSSLWDLAKSIFVP